MTIPSGPLREDIKNLKNYKNLFLNGNLENLDYLKKEILSINPNINIHIGKYEPININEFDISFIEKVGSNTLNEISSSISGQVNLWGAYDNIQHNGNLILNKTKFFIPYLNIEYLINDNSELTLYNQNIEFI